MKTQKLTLIELLISMAIFTLMISMLIKAFQVSADMSSRLEDQSQVYDYARLSLNLITEDLNKSIVNEIKKYEYDSTANAYVEKNKSIYFYAKTDATAPELCFFIQSNEENTNNSNIKNLKAINYRIATEDGTTGLYRYEKNYAPNSISGDDMTELFDANKNHLSIISKSDADDVSLIIKDSHLINWSVYLSGTDKDSAVSHPVIDDGNGNPTTGTYTLKDVSQIRIELNTKEAQQSEKKSLRNFARTVFLNK